MSVRVTPWSAACNDALQDGDWHDGLPIMRAAEKKITPGVALRKAENTRATDSAARHDGEPRERVVQRSHGTLIATGKRAIMQSVLHARVKARAWEVDPWPLPATGWTLGGWKVRDLRTGRLTLTAIAESHRIDKDTARNLMTQEPPLGRTVGRVAYITRNELPEFERRVEQYRAGAWDRRSAASKTSQAMKRLQVRTYYTLTQLCALSNIGSMTVRRLQQAHPELGWEIRGRSARLPLERLEDWEKVVAQYRQDQHEQRIQRSRRMGRANAASCTPTFADPALTQTFQRYQAGDTSLREEVHNGMREAFHRADVEAGDA